LTDLDLTPRDVPSEGSGSWRNRLIVVGLVAVAGFVLFQALTSARVYFLNVDEAVAQRAELGEDVFNIQGTVISEPVSTAEAMVFTMTFGGENAEIRHVGAEPTDLFKVGEQVVAKGHWEDGEFVSNQLLVKHSEEYVEDNPERLDYELDDTGDPAADASDNAVSDNAVSDDAVSDNAVSDASDQ